jgi:hypothetical protein
VEIDPFHADFAGPRKIAEVLDDPANPRRAIDRVGDERANVFAQEIEVGLALQGIEFFPDLRIAGQ